MSAEPRAPAKSTQQPDDGTRALFNLLGGIRKHWPIVVAATLLAAGVAFLYSKSQPKVYQATSMLEFDPNPVRPLGDKTDPLIAWTSYFDNQQNFETQFKIITSDSVLTKVVHDLGLASDPAFLGLKKPPAQPIANEDAVARLRARITVEPIKNSRLFLIKVDDTDPALAKRLCDAVARIYIAQNLQKSVLESGDAALWLSGQVDHYQQELEKDENELHEFKKKNELPSSTLEEVSKMIRLEMQQYDSALTTTRTRKQELIARHTELAKITVDNVDVIPASELLNNAHLQKLRDDYLRAQEHKRDVENRPSHPDVNHPDVIAAEAQVKEAKENLVKEVRNIQAAVARDLAIIEKQESGESALYEDARKRAVELNLKELEYHRLDRQRATNEKMYSTLLEKMKEADLARMMNVNNVRLIDPATQPKSPIKPLTLANVGIGTILGLVLGLGLAILREQLDSSVKTPADIEEKLGLTFLGMLPSLDEEQARTLIPYYGRRQRKKRAEGPRKTNDEPALYVHLHPLSGVAEAARSLRTNLMFMSPDKPYRTLLVTSSAPTEGKTTVACAIAIAMAQAGHRVCIVDCDLRRPRIHRVLGRPGATGVTSLLVGEATLDDVVKPAKVGPGGADIPNLWCVPAGSPPPNPADLLHSESFKKLLRELGQRFDRVIVDSPPLAAVTDSAIISTLVDATVFVVRAQSTSWPLARQGLRALRDVDSPIAGAVLNAVDFTKGDYSYYYQQYYYYRREGYGAAQAKRDDDERASVCPPN
jgi:capsular exopolysaccharide synthesis family protein